MNGITDNASSADDQQERVSSDREKLSYYLAGFVDGEGSFSVSIRKTPTKTRFGWTIDPLFQVYQHKDNARILFVFQKFFGIGYVSKKGGNPSCFVYCVDRTSDLIDVIIPFFDSYPLIGEKYNNFLLFKEIVTGLKQKEQCTQEGFKRLTTLCFQMNRHGYFRKISLETILSSLRQSSETIRRNRYSNGMI